MSRGITGLPPVQRDVVVLKGGLDQITPTMDLPPGFCQAAVNFEVLPQGGYGRIPGYERFDGQTAPSSAEYWSFHLSPSFPYGLPAAGSTITGDTSGATAYALGNLGTNTSAIVPISGTFLLFESYSCTDGSYGDMLSLPVEGGGTYSPFSSLQDAQLTAAAADYYRNLIQEVPGAGPVQGVWTYKDDVYAFRSDGAHTQMYRATGSGWAQVSFGGVVPFTLGNAAPIAPGDVVESSGIGATATVLRVLVTSGTWGVDAAGILVVDPVSGYLAGGSLLVGGVPLAVASAPYIPTVLSPGGKFECINANFYGGADTFCMYGCDGVNPAFEFDGNGLIPLATGFTPDAPKHLCAHKGYLFVSVQTSIGWCAPGNPHNWSAAAGAGTIGTGDTVTGLLELPGAQTTGAMAVFGLQNTFMLYGTDNTTWNFVTYNTGAGAVDYTAYNMDDAYFLDYRGVVSLKATLNYGNFDTVTLSNRVKSFILPEITSASYACVNRGKSQYRLFFSDGWGAYFTVVDGQNLGAMPVQFPDPVTCLAQGRLSNGTEVTYFGSDNGYVYQLDKGTSFDGAAINASITLAWNYSKSPRILKRYRRAAIELTGNGFCLIDFGYSVQTGASTYSQPTGTTEYANGLLNATYGTYTWSGNGLLYNECEMQGTGDNVAVTVSSNTAVCPAFSVNSVVLHYTPRRPLR